MSETQGRYTLKTAVTQGWIDERVRRAGQTATPGRMAGFVARRSDAVDRNLNTALEAQPGSVRTEALRMADKNSTAVASGISSLTTGNHAGGAAPPRAGMSNLGKAGIAAGALAAGYGAYRLLRNEPQQQQPQQGTYTMRPPAGQYR